MQNLASCTQLHPGVGSREAPARPPDLWSALLSFHDPGESLAAASHFLLVDLIEELTLLRGKVAPPVFSDT